MEVKTLTLRFVVDTLPDQTFEVIDFSGEEYVSRTFRFDVNLVSKKADISLNQIANQPATLEVYRGTEQLIFHGQVAHFEQGAFVGDNYGYRAVFVPKLWFLSLSFQSRIFQQVNVEEIVTQVLQDAGFSSSEFRFELDASYPPREYCVQYQETDLNFISRVLEHEGIYFFFDHETVVFSDLPVARNPKIPGGSALFFNPGGGLQASAEAVREFICKEQVVTGKVMLKDYNYRTPETTLLSESQLNGEMPGTYYEYGQHFQDQQQGDRLAEVRNQEIECRRRVMSGASGYVGMRVGHLFTMKEHFRDDFNGDFFLTSLKHSGTQGGSVPGMQQDAAENRSAYRNAFTCVPADVVYRPPRITPVPKVSGIQTGRIETAGGDYAYIDEEGRYRAKMHFDLSSAGDGEATRPIRMNQPYSGPDYGVHFPNHANTEVLWACIDGNIDRPLALGTVPNPSNQAPSRAENKMQNVIRTKAGNQIILDDTIDEAQVVVNTPDNNRMLFDDKDDRIVITTTNEHTMTFDDMNELIELKTREGHFVVLDDMNKKITCQSTDGHRISINDQDKLITLVDESGENIFQIDIGNRKLTIKTENGDIEMLAPNGTIDIKAKTLNMETTADTSIKAVNINTEAQQDHTQKATNVKAEATMNFEQKGGMNMTSEAGMEHLSKGLNVTSEAGVQQTVKGTLVTLQASAVNTIQGTLVKIN